MPTQILPVSSEVTASSDVTIAAGSQLTVSLKGGVSTSSKIDIKSLVAIELKDDGGLYYQVDSLTSIRESAVLIGAGTYRFARKRGTCGVFSG